MSMVSQTRQLAKKFVRFARRNLINVFGHKKYVKFIVVTRSRTGSNLLKDFLNSHRNIECGPEIFRRLNGKNWRDILAKQFSKKRRKTQAVGFKLFYYHPIDTECPELHDELTGLDDLRAIHLKRNNILRTLVSKKIADKTDVWESFSRDIASDANSKQIVFTAGELRKEFEQTRRWEKTCDELFHRHKMLQIEYESLVQFPDAEFKKVTEFLGVPPASPRASHTRQNPERLIDLISNFEEMKTAFSGTEWEGFFRS